MSIRAYVYFWLTVAFSIYLGIEFFNWHEIQGFSFFALGFLVLIAFLGELYEVEILPTHGVSASTAIYMGSILIGGTTLGLSITIPSLLLSEAAIRGEGFYQGASFTAVVQRLTFNTSQHVIAIIAAGLSFRLLGGHSAPFVTFYDYLPPLAGFSVYTLVNTALVSGMVTLTEGSNFFYQLKINLRDLHLQILSLGALSILVAIAYESSPWSILLVAALLFLISNSLRNYVNLQEQAKQTFEKIMDLLGKRDPYTHEHSESVGDLTEAIAEKMGITPAKKEDIVSAARVHDIGKLGIPDDVLLKKGELNEEEWETMKEHPELGADILSGLMIYEDAVDIVRHEHERWDGSGYPDGLEGEDIPQGSRIVAVADVWNALRTKRPYRGPLTKKEAKKEMEKMSGEKLDPEVADSLLGLVEKGEVEN